MTGVVPKLRTARDSTSGRKAGKRRGGNLPARLRFSARRGVTLVELMISMLILTLVCVAWLEIIGIQSARKEARRREAVERLVGIMDAFMYDPVMRNNGVFKVTGKNKSFTAGYYRINKNNDGIIVVNPTDEDEIQPIYNIGLSPIGYQLRILTTSKLQEELQSANGFGYNWTNNNGTECYWLVGKLYDYYGKKGEDKKPFFTLPVCLGR